MLKQSSQINSGTSPDQVQALFCKDATRKGYEEFVIEFPRAKFHLHNRPTEPPLLKSVFPGGMR